MLRSEGITLAKSVTLVLILILFSTFGLSLALQGQESPSDPSILKAEFDKALKSGETGKALALAEKLIETVEPEHYEVLYAAAQLEARAGNRERAYLFLSRAIGAGFNDRGRILEDEAFKDYRGEDLFKTLARRAWANGYADLLERSNREDVQKSPEIMKALAIRPGERVVDLGAGTGYFTFQLADAVGPAGTVWALDAAPEMIEYLDFRVKARRAANVKLRKVERDDPGIEPGSVDMILMVDMIHYVKDRTAYVKRLAPGLAPGGRIVIIDYIPKPMSERPWGPPPEQQFPKEQLDREMAAAGFEVAQAYDFLPEQFFVVYKLR